jgi:hypothetical protein
MQQNSATHILTTVDPVLRIRRLLCPDPDSAAHVKTTGSGSSTYTNFMPPFTGNLIVFFLLQIKNYYLYFSQLQKKHNFTL